MYDLHQLGWHNFQQLCLTISREILGQTVESFLDGNDGGRDGAFTGSWKPRGSEDITGQFVIQCKFTSKNGYNLSLSDLTDEFAKAKRLVENGRCDAYVLITNAGISGASEEAIMAAYKAMGVRHVLLFGSTWIWSQILESKRLRMLVPRVYGLGDLSQILDERAYLQARALLASMSEELSKIVMTDTYERFIPETARRLADPMFTKGLDLYRYELDSFVNNQESFLRDTLSGLDPDSKAALALIHMRNDSLESPIQLTASETLAIARLGSDLGGCVDALDSLKDSFVQFTAASGDALWRFRHPTIGDAYAAQLSDSPELLEIFVEGSSTEKLIDQVTCGDVGYEKAVVLPKKLFPLIIRQLDEFGTTSSYKAKWLTVWHAERRTMDFLARRCTKEFLQMYVLSHPELLEKVSVPGLPLSAVSELDVAIRLYEFDLLPEERRQQLVETVTTYAVEGEDLYALSDPDLREILTDEENATLRARVRAELVPRIGDVREKWQSERNSDESPQEKMQPLLDSLETIREEYDDPEVKKIVDRESQYINDWIAEEEEDDQIILPRESLSDLGESQTLGSERSMFDDIDT